MQLPRLSQIEYSIILGSLLSLLLAVSPSLADSNRTLVVDGVTYQLVELMGVGGESVTFYTDKGPLVIKWVEVPDGIRQVFAQSFSEALDRSSAAAVAVYKAPVQVDGTIVARVKEGTIVEMNNRRILLLDFSDTRAPAGAKISVVSKRAGVACINIDEGSPKTLQVYRMLDSKDGAGAVPAK